MKYCMPSGLWIATENKDVILKGLPCTLAYLQINALLMLYILVL